VSAVTDAGQQVTLSREECGFTYRGSRFQTDHSLIITYAFFDLALGDSAAIREHLESVRRHRAETQPQGRSAGCFFKNPSLDAPYGSSGSDTPPTTGHSGSDTPPTTGCSLSAGRLIELAGGKGLREGGAVVSETHANFVMNAGNATAADLRTLAERVRGMVREKHGIELEYEVRLVGEW
jgi:UDP-N-acetylmuramate dehydrogenase